MSIAEGSVLSCILIAANVCLHGAQNVEIKDVGFAAYAEVHAPGIIATITLRSDDINTPDWARMQEVCEKENCVSYYKHCAVGPAAVCDYYFSRQGDYENRRVTITVTNTSIAEAERYFGALAGVGGVVSEISFTKFTHQSDQERPPYCKRDEAQAACWQYAK